MPNHQLPEFFAERAVALELCRFHDRRVKGSLQTQSSASGKMQAITAIFFPNLTLATLRG